MLGSGAVGEFALSEAGAAPTISGTAAPVARGTITASLYTAHRARRRARVLAAAVAVLVLPNSRGVPPAVTGSGTIPISFGVAATGSPVVNGSGSVGITFGVNGTGTPVVNGSGVVPISFGVAATGTVGGGAAPQYAGRGLIQPISYERHRAAVRAKRLAYAPQLVQARQWAAAVVTGAGTIPIGFGVAGAGAPVINGAGTIPIGFGVAGTGTPVINATGTIPISFGVAGTGSAGSGGVGNIPITFGVQATATLGAPPRRRDAVVTVAADYAAHRAAQQAKRRAHSPEVVAARRFTGTPVLVTVPPGRTRTQAVPSATRTIAAATETTTIAAPSRTRTQLPEDIT